VPLVANRYNTHTEVEVGMVETVGLDDPILLELKDCLRLGAAQLDRTRLEIQAIAGELEEGSLLGRGGDAFTLALRESLALAIGRLSSRLTDLAGEME
jgi:hypothetical protein